MSDDDKRSLVTRQEILPPLRQTGSNVTDASQLPRGLLGISFFARARYASEQKQIEAFTMLERARNQLRNEYENTCNANVSLAIALGRASQLPTYRKAGETQAHLELGLIQEKLDSLKQRSDLANLAYQEEKAVRLLRIDDHVEELKERRELSKLAFEEEKELRLLRIAQTKRTHENFLNPPPPPPPPKKPPTTADKIRSVGQEIDDIQRAFAEQRASMVAAAGGEANLSDDARRALGQFEVLKNNLLNEVMGALY